MYDLSGANPIVVITNHSEGAHLDLVTWWFQLSSGGGNSYHNGDSSSPDKSGVWTTYNVAEPMPQVLGHIEWSGSYFKVVGSAKDSHGKIFTLEKTTRLCRPNGNNGSQANNFGVGVLDVITKCDKARLYVEDKTDYTYAGFAGVNASKFFKLIFPPDSTGTIPAPKQVNNVNNALIPISRNGDGYQIILSAVYQYDFDNGTSVKIKYKFQKVFKIQCDVDLCPLICEIQRLEERYEQSGCNAAERDNLALINSKMNRAMMAKMQPLCGVDVGAIIDEIKMLGGFTCSCEGDEFNGINALDSGTMACPDVIDCINVKLNEVNPKCLATQDEWDSWSLVMKIQKLINTICCPDIVGLIAD